MHTPFAILRLQAFSLSIFFLLAACGPLSGSTQTSPLNTAPPTQAAAAASSTQTLPVLVAPTALVSPSASPPAPAASPLPLPPADESSARLNVPDGFAIRIFAQDLNGKPRFMAFGPDGALYLSLTSAGMVVRLADIDQNGLADSTQVAASGLNQPHGLAWQGDWLYVAENDRIERLRSTTADGVFDVIELVTNNLPGGAGHYTRTIHFGPDEKMYVSAGSSCNVCAESDPRRAAILRFNPDGSIPADNPFAADADDRKRPLWAWGLRNSVDFLWTPSGQMWANGNGRDNLLDANGMPDNLPPEVIVSPIQGGQFFGWPYCFTPSLGFNRDATPQVLDNQSGLALPAEFDCSQSVPALFTDLAHSAPLGMTLGQEGNFPPAYLADLFVAYHGSWNVQDPANFRDCKVERVIVENGQPVRSEPFVNGWRAAGETCGSPSAYGRPADVVFGADGAMYISDDAGGRVYRLIHVP